MSLYGPNKEISEERYRVLILGGGLSSLCCAARLSELGVEQIGIFARGAGGTPYIAAINFVLPDNPFGDTAERYYKDMIEAGYRINDRTLVRDMAENSIRGYELLTRWGIRFSKNADGTCMLRHLSGHSCPRSLCNTKELLGASMGRELTAGLKKRGISIAKGWECRRLLTEGGRVIGAVMETPKGGLKRIYGDYMVAAWGGAGRLLGVSTYPEDIKGNTLAMAWEAGASLVDIEFLEYEPMVVLFPKGAAGEPCPTAMLGEGAYLKNRLGERFLLRVRSQGEAGAPKSLLNREIWGQIAAGNGTEHGGVFVDLRHIDETVLKAYPWFYNRLVRNGLDPKRSMIEVGPVAHSFSGGIRVDRRYHSEVPGLYAVGEACGGIHGACRCAGNAASQAVLSGLLCAEAITSGAEDGRRPQEPAAKESPNPAELLMDPAVRRSYKELIQTQAVKALGPYRDGRSLRAAQKSLEEVAERGEVQRDVETEQMIRSLLLMIQSADRRRESRGTHLRTDFPEEEKEFETEIIVPGAAKNYRLDR